MTNLEIKGIFQTMDVNKDNIVDDREWLDFHEHFTAEFQ